MDFVKAALKKEIPAGKMKSVEIAGIPVLLANVAGEYYAIGNKCTHRGCKLSSGIFEGETVKCPCHKSIFNVKTGEVVHGPASKPEPTYTVEVEKEQILVSVK
ncbi:TPA: Rieske (2Fe-2S) protein [Candidatus Bathyarchaeota archaeon]|nr:Rieske (2Fe-2S) protein [Candidatus Bathyarchaeota archaeon]HIJ08385.1 Rieske (2Fe-2S) protein [Candidatus Bathyarchaeota archaeon]